MNKIYELLGDKLSTEELVKEYLENGIRRDDERLPSYFNQLKFYIMK